MKFIDLHVHSTMSDGTYTPEGIIDLAKKRGLSAVTLTDHDTIDGLKRASQEADKAGMNFIAGMEISTAYQGRKLHIVALGFDPNSDAFKKLYKAIRYNKENKMDKVIDKIRDKGIDISLDKVAPFINGSKLEGYAIMRYLVSLHLTDKVQTIWDTYLNPSIHELGLDKNISVEEVVKGVHQAGGVTSLAHFHKLIGLKGMDRTEQEKSIAYLHNIGLDGMEKYYSSYTDDDNEFAAAMIDKYDLLPTGGSDFHGGNRVGVELGTGHENNLHIPYEFYENIVDNCKKA